MTRTHPKLLEIGTDSSCNGPPLAHSSALKRVTGIRHCQFFIGSSARLPHLMPRCGLVPLSEPRRDSLALAPSCNMRPAQGDIKPIEFPLSIEISQISILHIQREYTVCSSLHSSLPL